MPLFSVIVPVYNSERTLQRCLSSLQNQTEADFEVLMVENCSLDGSAALCRAFAAQDSRFQLVTLDVQCGPSGARNAGLDRANGSYIAFVDSDDYVEPSHLACLRETFEAGNPDAVFFGYHQVSVDGQDLGEHIPELRENLPLPEQLTALSGQDMFGYTWIKAFRRDAIGQARFPMGLNLFEDEIFACSVLKNARKIAVVPSPLYHYVTGNPGSLIGRTHPDYPAKCDRVFQAWETLLAGRNGAEEALIRKANSAAARCMYYCFERDVDLRGFVDALADAAFFARHTNWSPFDRLVQKRRYGLIQLKKLTYRLKQLITKMRCKSPFHVI